MRKQDILVTPITGEFAWKENIPKDFVSREEFIKIHDMLLLGTSSGNKLGVRDNDLKFVGSYQRNRKTKYYFEKIVKFSQKY